MNSILLACALVLAALPAFAGETDTVISGTARTGNLSTDDIDARLDTAAQDSEANGVPATRFELFDMAVPPNAADYKAMAGYTVMLVVAVTQDAGELPLERVYLQAGATVTPLRQIYAVSHDTAAGSDARRAFGRAREFALYLVPTAAMLTQHDIRCDLAKTRKGLLLGSLHFEPLPYAIPDATPAKPSPAALLAFLKHEYPGLTSGLTEKQLP